MDSLNINYKYSISKCVVCRGGCDIGYIDS